MLIEERLIKGERLIERQTDRQGIHAEQTAFLFMVSFRTIGNEPAPISGI